MRLLTGTVQQRLLDMFSSRYAILLTLVCAMTLSACGGSGGGSNDGGSSGESTTPNGSANNNAGGGKPAGPAEGGENEKPTEPTVPEDGDDGGQTGDGDGASQPENPDKSDPDADSGPDENGSSDDKEQPDEETDPNPGTPDDNNSASSGNDEDEDEDNDSASSGNGAPDQFPSSTDSATARFRVVSTGNNADDPSITIGQVFARGAVAPDQTLAASIDDQRIPIQVDKKATWQDGTLRHAVVTVRLPQDKLGSNPVVTLNAINTPDAGASLTAGQVLATSFDANVSLKIDGSEYSASARALLSQASQMGNCGEWAAKCKQWLSGPLASEWIIGGPISAGGKEHPHLSVYFHVRAYADASGAVSRVRVDSVIENNWAYAPDPGNQRYDARITVGKNSFDAPNLTHYRRARWHKVMWWNGDPKTYARLDTEYLQSTGAISNYADLNLSKEFLNSRPTEFKPLTNGNQTAHMGQTGAQAAIGPLPRWTSTYVVSGAQRAFEWMLANDDAVGSYGFHYRDSDTGRPLRITDHPYVTLAAISFARRATNENYKTDVLPACKSDCKSPYSFDIPHHPSIGYVPYLVTGDYYYLEEMQFAASYVELWANPAYRNFDNGRLRRAQSQTRGQAWALRSIADAAFATPDTDPMKPYFEDQVATIISDYLTHYVDADDPNPLGLIVGKGEWVSYPLHGKSRVGIAPWQMDFFTWSVGHAAEQGLEDAPRLLEWVSQFQIGMMTNWLDKPDTGYCWLVASGYKLQIRPSRDAPDYRTLDEAYKNTFPSLYGLDCNSQEYVNQLSALKNKRFKRGQMSGYAPSPTGFPSNLQIGLAMAADSGVSNGKKAWQIFESRSVKPDYDKTPNFAVVPRF